MKSERYNKDMINIMKLKVEQDSTLKNCKFEDLNSTDEEKHPSEFTYVEA